MTITNGYASLAEFQNMQRVASSDSNDDDAIELIIEAASRYIDDMATTRFYSSSGDEYYDVPNGDTIYFRENATAINSITNGDGSTVTAYVTLGTPIYGVRLKPNAGARWMDAAGNPYQCIKVNADWGSAVSTPTDIKQACLMIAKAAYNRRFGDNMTSTSIVTNGGVFITPEDVPASAREMVLSHKRNTIG